MISKYTGEYDFSLNDDGMTYSAMLTHGAELLILPTEHDGKPVTTVWANEAGAENRNDVKEVIVPEGIITVEGELFESFLSLRRISLPSSLEYISASCISGCDSLYEIDVDPSNQNFRSLNGNLCSKDGAVFIKAAPMRIGEAFELPYGIEKIGEAAFEGCKKIKDIRLPETVSEIEKNAFAGCKALESIRLSAALKKIGSFAFAFCEALNEIRIPISAEALEHSIFLNASKNLTVRCEASEPGELWDEEWYENAENIVWNAKL